MRRAPTADPQEQQRITKGAAEIIFTEAGPVTARQKLGVMSDHKAVVGTTNSALPREPSTENEGGGNTHSCGHPAATGGCNDGEGQKGAATTPARIDDYSNIRKNTA